MATYDRKYLDNDQIIYEFRRKYRTKGPTGVSIKQDGELFTLTWKKADEDYEAGLYCTIEGRETSGNRKTTYRSNPWKVMLLVDATSYTFTLNSSRFHPFTKNKLGDLSINMYAKRKSYRVKQTWEESWNSSSDTTYPVYYEYSDNLESGGRGYLVFEPPLPAASLTEELTGLNQTTFTSQFDVDEHRDPTDTRVAVNRWTTRYQWESQLIRDSSVSDGSKLTWASGKNSFSTNTTTDSTFEKQFTDNRTDAGFKVSYTLTRWFRVRAQGPNGDSAWKYARHVYAIPEKATVLSNKVTAITGGLLIWMKWKLSSLELRPVDTAKVQYLIATPNANMAAPTTGWTDAPGGTVENASANQALTFSIQSVPGLDNCLWGRVLAIHDTNDISYSEPVLIYKSKLNKPTGLSVTVNTTTHKATVTATNNSQVPDSYLVVTYVDKNNPKGIDIGIIPHGSSRIENLQCPNWGTNTPSFSVRANVGSYTQTAKGGVLAYDVKSKMASDIQRDGGNVPMPPASVTVSQADLPNTLNVRWTWTWTDATEAEISWADHEDAWMSTSGPSTYTVDSLNLPTWNISGVDTGKTWYIRVRLGQRIGDSVIYGPYSATEEISMGSSPQATSLYLSKSVITAEETVTAYWTYTSEDNTTQASAEVALVNISGNSMTYTTIARVESEQHVVLDAAQLNWQTGETYSLVLRATSMSGKQSEWSNPASITIADQITANITSDSFVHDKVVIADDETGATRTITALTELPITITVDGASVGTTTITTITRAGEYHLTRPDESEFNGYSGEVIAYNTSSSSEPIVIDKESLIGFLDDGADYRLTVTVSDKLGQTATDYIDFEVCWDRQAIIPEATATLDSGAALLNPIAPTGTQEGDVCDIYRLSTDKPEMVYEGATFGETYVDPYPTIGESGGYRFVFRTPNGDYITADHRLAWVDIPVTYETLDNIIDFDGRTARITYNVDLSNNWSKDFKETQYLGGSVQGDWNAAIGRSASINGVIPLDDQESIETMRLLASHPGICRVRTRDGSNFAADVQVSESRGHEPGDLVATFSLNVTRVDQEVPPGMSYSDWENTPGD